MSTTVELHRKDAELQAVRAELVALRAEMSALADAMCEYNPGFGDYPRAGLLIRASLGAES